MIMSRNFHCHERHIIDLLSKMANQLPNHVQQRQRQQQQQPVVASERKLKMQARFVILLLTLVSTYRASTSYATTINRHQHQLANTTGASRSSNANHSNSSKVETDFAAWWPGDSIMPSMFTDADETTGYDNGTSTTASDLLDHRAVAGLRDYYGTLFSFGFEKLVNVLVDGLFELNEMVELDCSRGMRGPRPPAAATGRNKLNSPFINHLVAAGAPGHSQGRKQPTRLKRSSSSEPELESDAILADTIGEARQRKKESDNHRVHREAPRRGSPQMIRSVNPARNVTHMNMMLDDRDATTRPEQGSNAAASHLQDIDQDHLYDERNFDRNEADDSLRHKSNRKARRQSSSWSLPVRKDRTRHSSPSPSSSTTTASSTTTITTAAESSPTNPAQAAASMAPTVVSEQGLGAGGESTLESATASPDQSAGAAAENGNVESPISELAMPQHTEQPASVYNDLDLIDEPRNERPGDLPAQQQQPADDGGGGGGGQSDAQVELLPGRARSDQRQRANLMADGAHQGASRVPVTSSSLSTQIPPPEQSPTKSSSHREHHHHQHQKGRRLPTGNLVFNGYSGGESSNNNTDHHQQQELVPQVGDAQVLDHSGAGSTKEQQLRQLLRFYELNENSLAKRLTARQPNISNNHHQNQASQISSLGEYPSQPPYIGQNQLYHEQLNGDGAATASSFGQASGASPPQMVVRSQAPYAVPSNGASGLTTTAQSPSSLFANGENLTQNPQAQSSMLQALAALDSIDGGGVGRPQMTQQAIINYIRLNPAAAAALSGQRHRSGAAAPSAEAASQIEENFYNSNGISVAAGATNKKYSTAAAATALAQLQQQQQDQIALNNNNIEPSTKLRRITGSSSKQALDVITNPAYNGYRGNRVISPTAIDASQTPDNGQLVQGFLRATNPIAYGSTTASSTIRAQHSSPLLRRTSPLIALPASLNNNQQLAIMRAPYRDGVTSAYLLPAGYPPASPYSSTSARYLKQSNANGPIQRQMINTSSQQRVGKLANSNGATNSAGNNNYDDSPSVSSTQASASSTVTSDPMWSDTQNQEDDYQQAPQTIQITAVPNGFGGGLWNGVNGFNPLVGAGWNGGWGGPWNGRQVLLVNRQPATVGSSGLSSEWRQWVLPVAAILALPLILGALFVPVFLKSIMFLIQILQMLGLLMPPAQLAGHLASSSHTTSSG